MKTSFSETLDLALTQAIECYRELPADQAYEAICRDWHEQTAVLLYEFLYKNRCENCGAIPDYIEFERESGDSNYIMSVCCCDAYDPF